MTIHVGIAIILKKQTIPCAVGAVSVAKWNEASAKWIVDVKRWAMSRGLLFGFAVALLLAVTMSAGSAWGAPALFEDFGEGSWRVEFTAVGGAYSGKVDRGGDFWFTGSVEYDWPIYARAVLGLKAYPLFLYLQDENDDDESDTIHGAGLGIAARFYFSKEERKGFYGEVGASTIWHSRYLERNTSRLNFLSEVGIGYEFRNDWHMAVKWEHISNGGMGSRNAGVNGVGLAFGYTF